MNTPFPLSVELPEKLEFSGEFGAELNSFVPFIYWLHMAGLMEGRRVRTYDGMRPFYFFLQPSQFEEKTELRRHVLPSQRPSYWPTRNDHLSTRTAFEIFPDYRSQYRNSVFVADKPLLAVHNKYGDEWGLGPVNFFSPMVLETMFARLQDRFTIVYIRPGIKAEQIGYSRDHQPDYCLNDMEVVRRHGSVLLFEDFVSVMAGTKSYNELKLMLYANTYFYLTVQGGNAHLISLFGGSLVGIFHRLGQEILHSYAGGHFQYASNTAPLYLIARSQEALERVIGVLQTGQLICGRATPSVEMAEIAESCLPLVPCGRDRMSHTQ